MAGCRFVFVGSSPNLFLFSVDRFSSLAFERANAGRFTLERGSNTLLLKAALHHALEANGERGSMVVVTGQAHSVGIVSALHALHPLEVSQDVHPLKVVITRSSSPLVITRSRETRREEPDASRSFDGDARNKKPAPVTTRAGDGTGEDGQPLISSSDLERPATQGAS